IARSFGAFNLTEPSQAALTHQAGFVPGVLWFARLRGSRLAAYGRGEHLRVRQPYHVIAGAEPQVGNPISVTVPSSWPLRAPERSSITSPTWNGRDSSKSSHRIHSPDAGRVCQCHQPTARAPASHRPDGGKGAELALAD